MIPQRVDYQYFSQYSHLYCTCQKATMHALPVDPRQYSGRRVKFLRDFCTLDHAINMINISIKVTYPIKIGAISEVKLNEEFEVTILNAAQFDYKAWSILEFIPFKQRPLFCAFKNPLVINDDAGNWKMRFRVLDPLEQDFVDEQLKFDKLCQTKDKEAIGIALDQLTTVAHINIISTNRLLERAEQSQDAEEIRKLKGNLFRYRIVFSNQGVQAPKVPDDNHLVSEQMSQRLHFDLNKYLEMKKGTFWTSVGPDEAFVQP